MARKYDGALRNKERTKLKLLDAVGEIIRSEGFSQLQLTKIEKIAGVNRKLIYDYFGAVKSLIETYIRSKDYWVSYANSANKIVEESTGDHGRELIQMLLLNQLDSFSKDGDMQQIVLWQISHDNPLISEICAERERIGKILLTSTDSHFNGTNVDIRARMALMIAGIYFLVLHSKKVNSLFCGIDLNTPDGMERIKTAITNMSEEAYVQADKHKTGDKK